MIDIENVSCPFLSSIMTFKWLSATSTASKAKTTYAKVTTATIQSTTTVVIYASTHVTTPAIITTSTTTTYIRILIRI
jgi:hypothetical protein